MQKEKDREPHVQTLPPIPKCNNCGRTDTVLYTPFGESLAVCHPDCESASVNRHRFKPHRRAIAGDKELDTSEFAPVNVGTISLTGSGVAAPVKGPHFSEKGAVSAGQRAAIAVKAFVMENIAPHHYPNMALGGISLAPDLQEDIEKLVTFACLSHGPNEIPTALRDYVLDLVVGVGERDRAETGKKEKRNATP